MQSLSWHPWVLPSPHPPFPGVRPQLSLAAASLLPQQAGHGHTEAGTGAGAGAGAGAAAAAPLSQLAFWCQGADEFLPSLPPHYGSRLSTFIQRCCDAAETPPQAAALLISWEANERSHRGTCLYSHRVWQPQRSRSPSPRACRDSPWPVQPPVWWQKHGAMPRRGQGTHILPTRREAAGAMGTAPCQHPIQGFHHVPPQHPWKKHLEMLESMVP